MIETILMVVPTILAVLCLALFNEKTRWFCYTLVILSVASELVPLQINVIALAATCSALIALIGLDVFHHIKAPKSTMVKH